MHADLPPLAHAAHVEALARMLRTPDPHSFLAEAKAHGRFTVRAGDAEKRAFDALQVLVASALGRRSTQVETLRWLIAFALAHPDALVEAAAHRAPVGARLREARGP